MPQSVLVQEALLAAQKQAELDAQDVTMNHAQSLEEQVVYEEQIQEEQVDLAADNLTVSEGVPDQETTFEVEESVQGLVVSVKELWSCVIELKKQTEESAKEVQEKSKQAEFGSAA